jgi:glycine cleavage system H protein
MEGFTYNNIFATKGIEYIIILSFLAVLVPFWLFISQDTKVKQKIRDAVNVLTAGILKIPQGLLFTKTHTWVHLEKSGEAKIGLDDFLMHMFSNMKINPLKKQGEHITKGELLAEIVQDGKKLKMRSPISGKITSANSLVTENCNMVKDDPYEKGWFYAVEPDNWKAETSGFYLANEATDWITNELLRLKDFLSTSINRYSGQPAMLTLQEGGELKADPLDDLQPEIWNDFQKEFLD